MFIGQIDYVLLMDIFSIDKFYTIEEELDIIARDKKDKGTAYES